MSKLPKGELTCNRNGKYVKWFCTINHTRNYISKGERDFAEKLAEKKYLLTLKDDLEQELEICTNINNKQKVFSPKHQQLLEQKEYADLLKKHFSSKYHKYRDWMNEDYEKNTSHPETLIHEYNDAGWTLGINLIVTTETKDEPLTYLTIENKIKEFFLD